MKDENKTKEQLINEILELRQRFLEEKKCELEEKSRAGFENTGIATIIFDVDMTISMIVKIGTHPIYLFVPLFLWSPRR